MLKKGPEEVSTLVFNQQRAGHFVGQVVDVLGDEIGHFAVFGMTPAVVNDIEVRGIRWQKLHVYPPAIELTELPCRFAVSAEAIPDHQERALEVPVELLHEGEDIIAGEIVRGDRKIESQALLLGGDGDRTGHREAIMAVPRIVDRRLALRRPRTAHRRLEHEAGLIKKNKGTAITPGFF